jgi:NAD+ kinase
MTRRVLLVGHPGRPEALDVAAELVEGLTANDIEVIGQTDELSALGVLVETGVTGYDAPLPDGSEVVVVLGGDGTILRAAELVRLSDVPLLGVNMGHVGFLAEAEADDLALVIQRVVERRWDVEERRAVEVQVYQGDELVHEDWALNEAAVEKAARERMLEIVLEVDGRPLSAFGCDGVVVSTSTGSTAYGFSAGGPVIWPTVDAMLVVPLSAHALFARPLVVPPTSAIAIEIEHRTPSPGVLWCDGRRMFELEVGARIEVVASPRPVRLARIHSGQDRFTDRLVRKFDLPVSGWRGPGS